MVTDTVGEGLGLVGRAWGVAIAVVRRGRVFPAAAGMGVVLVVGMEREVRGGRARGGVFCWGHTGRGGV